MPKEIHYYGTSGQTLYAVALASWYGLFWNVALFGNEYYNASNWADYAIPMTEEGAGIYFGDVPQTGGKVYAVIYQQAGGAPATTDTIVGKFEVELNTYTGSPLTDSDLLAAIISAVPDPINAIIVGWKGKEFPWGAKTSVSGNNITVSWTEQIEDSNSTAYVGWAVWFYLTIAGYPPYTVPWFTTVTAHSGNTITVAAMPPQDLTYSSFNVYLFPPGWAGGGGGGATAEDVAAAVLVTPANKLATGEGGAVLTLAGHTPQSGDSYARLGAPAGASVSADIAAVKADTAPILVDTDVTIPALLSGLSGAIVTVVSSVDGGTITVFAGDTWRFTLLSDELTLDDYDTLGLVIKRSEKQPDEAALLYLRTDEGLVRIGGAAPLEATNGELTKTTNSFSALVHLDETQELIPGSYLWWLKAFDDKVDPVEAKTLVTGGFALRRAGLQAVE